MKKFILFSLACCLLQSAQLGVCMEPLVDADGFDLLEELQQIQDENIESLTIKQLDKRMNQIESNRSGFAQFLKKRTEIELKKPTRDFKQFTQQINSLVELADLELKRTIEYDQKKRGINTKIKRPTNIIP